MRFFSRAFFARCFRMKNDIAPTIAEESEPLEGLPATLEIQDQDLAREWGRIPTRAAQVIALGKLGFTTSDICKGYGLTPQGVKIMRSKYDPDGTLRLPPTVGRVIAAYRFESTALRALDGITADKLDKASALQLATVAGIAADKAQRLRDSVATDRAREDVAGILSAMRAHVAPALPDPDTTTG